MSSDRKIKILWLSDSPFTNTGYSSQTLFLNNKLKDYGYQSHVMAHNYIGQDINAEDVKLSDGTVFKFSLSGIGREGYCKDLIIPRIRKFNPDFFIILLDTFMLYPWFLDMDLAPAKTIFWVPSDGGRFPKGCENILRKVNLPIMMSKYGQKQVKDLYNINSYHIPHGVDSNLFKPLSVDDKRFLKNEFVVQNIDGLKFKGFLKNKFVVGIVGRNQNRKMHDRAIKSFSIFCKDKPNAVLLCHFDPLDLASVFDFKNLINYYNLQNRVVFTGTKYYDGFTYKQMNEVYNVFDVYFSSTSGEGFGIPTIEAMSCEIPVVIPAYTTGEELIKDNDAGLVVNLVGCDDIFYSENLIRDYDLSVSNGTITGGWDVERGLMDIKDAADKLTYLFNNSDEIKRLGVNGRKAVIEKYDWVIICKMWDDVFRGSL